MIMQDHVREALEQRKMESAYRWAIVSAIRFGPQIESLGPNLRIKLGKTTKEPLQDMPS